MKMNQMMKGMVMSKLEIVCKKEDVVSIVQTIHERGGKGEKGVRLDLCIRGTSNL